MLLHRSIRSCSRSAFKSHDAAGILHLTSRPCSRRTAARAQNVNVFLNPLSVICGKGHHRLICCRAGSSFVQSHLESLDLPALELELEQAVKSEEYSKAAAIKARIEKLEEEDAGIRLQKELSLAIKDERYEDAARIKKELEEVKDRELEEYLKSLPSIPQQSEAVTKGVKVEVESMFAANQSVVEVAQYMFSYKVSITNTSDSTVRLLTRHWKITDGNGNVKHVRGDGVVGAQPVLKPGSHFEYTSICPLRTPHGVMEGEYGMKVLLDDGEWGDAFEAKIGRFSLKMDRSGYF